MAIDHKCWIMNGKVSSRVQAAEMGFSRRVYGLILFKFKVVCRLYLMTQATLRLVLRAGSPLIKRTTELLAASLIKGT